MKLSTALILSLMVGYLEVQASPQDSVQAVAVHSPTLISATDSLRASLASLRLPSLGQGSRGLSSLMTRSPFGGRAFQLRLRGAVELSPLLRQTKIENPLIDELDRERHSFLLNPKVQLRAEAKIGRKLSLDINYDTEALREDAQRSIHINYRGDSTELIRHIELGSLSYTPQNSLMGTSRPISGIKGHVGRDKWDLQLFLSQNNRLSSRPTIPTQRGEQRFSLRASDYDARRHFFLGKFFRSHYDEYMAQRPEVASGVQILRIEVWVGGRQSNATDTQNAMAFSDLSEGGTLHNAQLISLAGNDRPPSNDANNLPELFSRVASGDLLQMSRLLGNTLQQGADFERLEYARKLNPTEYVINRQMGYISLVKPLAEAEVLAVAYEYSYQGQIYRVGELSERRLADSSSPLMLKLLYGRDDRADAPYWTNMMRNVYAIATGAVDIRTIELTMLGGEGSRSTAYFTDGELRGRRLTDILGTDLLDSRGQAGADGHFDRIDGLTTLNQYGWIYLPSIEPFGEQLIRQGATADMAYRALYLEPIEIARQRSQQDRYRIEGSYLSNSPLPEYNVEREVAPLRQTFMGLDLSLHLRKNLDVGLSFMHLREQTEGNRTMLGAEPLSNTLWGANIHWHSSLPWLQRAMQWIAPHLSAPSRLSIDAEGAYLLPNYALGADYNGYSVVDNFDDSYQAIDLMQPQQWTLASRPKGGDWGQVSEGIAGGYGRGQLAWFSVDPALLRGQSGIQPAYLRSNPQLLSSHYLREIGTHELYPLRETNQSQANYLPTFNLRFYPRERGMYNLQTEGLDSQGFIANPQASWAGIQRSIEGSNFDSQNVEYLEFWLLDPYLERQQSPTGGELLIHLGEVSEDVLPDGRKAYENGLPLSSEGVATSIYNDWGQVSTSPTIGYAFGGGSTERQRQDLGYNGLSSNEEQTYPAYRSYVDELRRRVLPTTLARWQADRLSPLNDPAGDDFRHYRDSYYDEAQTPLLDRYKYYNGVEGNSSDLRLSSQAIPDSEDINHNNTLDEEERYFEYRLSLMPQDLRIGSNHIITTRTEQITLANGEVSEVRWYQFRIPLSDYRSAIGGIRDFRSIRFMRMLLRGMNETTDLRFVGMRFMKGVWRTYTQALSPTESLSSTLHTGSVSIEEHGERTPINYILPPDVTRPRGMGEADRREGNEQSLILKVDNLTPNNSKAIYKQVNYDLRPYERLQMYVHAEQLTEHVLDTQDGDLTLFLRLGNDLTHNYYEYSLPLSLSPEGRYHNANPQDRWIVWPQPNLLDLDLRQLAQLKLRRNRAEASSSTEIYREETREQANHQYAVLGNPSLGQVRMIMIGIRNGSQETRSAEVWVNELRTTMPQREASWATKARMTLDLSSAGQIALEGRHSQDGFGTIDDRFHERRQGTEQEIRLLGSIDLGKLAPPKWQTTIPLSYRYEESNSTPRYNPLDDDLYLSDAPLLTASSTKRSTSLSLLGLNVGLRSKQPMPYDPANLRLDYSYSRDATTSPSIAYRYRLNWMLNLSYDYNPSFRPLTPFRQKTGHSAWSRYLQSYQIELWPRKVALQSLLSRSYEEEQLRDLWVESADSKLSLSFSDQFFWNRKLSLIWRPIPELNLNLSTGTEARIEAPIVQVNRSLNPDDYSLWKESVERSLMNLGTPYRYSQQTSAVYTLPLSSFPRLSWLSGAISYNASYEWLRGAYTRQQLPHTISSQSSADMSLQINAERLYTMLGLGQKSSSLLALRSISIGWQYSSSLYLPGYTEEIGKAFGQSNVNGSLQPGLRFALGMADGAFIENALREGLLTTDARLALSGVHSISRILNVKASLQPIKGLNINLIANHSENERHEYLYAPSSSPIQHGGDMQMTTIGLRGFFATGATGGNKSALLQRFIDKRSEVYDLLQSQIARSQLSTYVLDPYSPAVLLPAFRQSYMLSSYGLSAIPHSLLALLPNWDITYSMRSSRSLLGLPLSTFTLKHAYRGIYRTNSYDSKAGWLPLAGTNLAYLTSVDGGRLGALEDVSSISLSESFFPLIGVDVGLKNGLTITGQWRRSRQLTLGVATARLIESRSNEWMLGLSYRIADLRTLWKPRVQRAKFSQGLSLKVDYSQGATTGSISMITSGYEQSTLGNDTKRLNLSLDYELSRACSLRGFYEWRYDIPTAAVGAYPALVRSYGLSVRLSLSQ